MIDFSAGSYYNLSHPPKSKTYKTIPTPYFSEVSKIAYEGPKSKNPLAFKHYNPDELVEGKSMREHLRFTAAYRHAMP